jgi:hypothetical protein
MKLSDQIALLRETLEEFGYTVEDGESVGEAADGVIREREASKCEPIPPVEPDEVDDDVLESWRGFWADLVIVDGVLDINAVANELHDYHTAITQVPLVYEEVTGGRLSKPNSRADYVLDYYNEQVDAMVKQAVADAKEQWEDERLPADGLCDTCHYLKDGALPRLCHNPEAWLEGFSRRGYSVKQGHGCECWNG